MILCGRSQIGAARNSVYVNLCREEYVSDLYHDSHVNVIHLYACPAMVL